MGGCTYFSFGNQISAGNKKLFSPVADDNRKQYLKRERNQKKNMFGI